MRHAHCYVGCNPFQGSETTAQLVASDSKNTITLARSSAAAIRLHVIAGHDLIGCRDEAIEPLLVPYKVRALHGAGIAVVLKRTGFPSDNIVEVRTQAIAFLGRVAGPACVVKCQLPRPVSAPLPTGSWGTAGKPRSTRNVVQTNPEIAVLDVLLAIERAYSW